MLSRNKSLTRFALLGALTAAPTWAESIEDAATELCEHVKACAMAQVAEEQLTPEVRQMMEPMLANMCANMRARVGEVPMNHELYTPAVECMQSMSAVSCEDFQEPERLQTPACEKYQELAKIYFPEGTPEPTE